MKHRTPLASLKNQSGMASILITMVTMVVVSLIVLGFAAISRREQTATLNQQLSTQAFYAAETGVNDVVHLARQAFAAGDALPAKTNCNNAVAPYSTLNNVIDSAHNVSYSCLLVNPAPTVLNYDDINAASTVVPLKSSGNNIASLHLVWSSKDGSSTPLNTCGTTTTLPPSTDWGCGYGVLRFDLVPTSGQTSVDNLQSEDMTRFMVPVRNGGSSSIGYNTSPSAQSLYPAQCTNDNCSLTITGLDSSQYYLRVMSLYKDSSLKISAEDTGGSPVGLESSQIVVDVTGKAQDVLRRIQVHVDISGNNTHVYPDNGLQSAGSVCKRFSLANGFFDNAISDISGVTGSDRLCGGTGSVGGGDESGTIGGKPGPAGPNQPQPGPHWAVTYFIHTAPPASEVSYCVWDWADGNTDTYSGSKCQPGVQSAAYHDYQPHTLACHQYIIYTYFHLKDGSVIQSNPLYADITWSTDPAYHCPHG